MAKRTTGTFTSMTKEMTKEEIEHARQLIDSGMINIETASGRLALNVMAALSQYEREREEKERQ